LPTPRHGIEILRTTIGDDGSLVVDKPHRDIKAGPGAPDNTATPSTRFPAGNVIVRGNRIRNCDYSGYAAIRRPYQITGNSISDVREVALYSEFSFEGP